MSGRLEIILTLIMNKLRKFLVVGVMVLSVISMSGLVIAPSVQASASAGDLIKMDGLSAVYYLSDNGKRYVFPNSTVYNSWYSDFSGVVTIPASELQSYPLGGNVTMRPGTKLIKITTDPSVYAVEPNGVLRKIGSEAQASALYGSNWNKRIVDVADSYFVNYSLGTALPDGQIPAGSLVKNASGASVYYYDGTNYRMVSSEAALTANRLWLSNVLTVTNTLTAGGTAIAGMETALVKTSQNAAVSGPVSTGSGLMVSLNSTTATSASVPKNGTRVPFAKYNLTASNDGDIVVDAITIKRTGLSDYTAFTGTGKVWMEKNGVRVTAQKTMSSNDEAILTFTPALTISAGQTVTLEVLASLNGATGNAALSIVSAAAVSAGKASVTGSFPVVGNLMSFTDYNVAPVKFDGADSTKTLKVGDTKADFGSFDLSFATTSKDVIFKSIMLKNTGAEDLAKSTANLYLEKNGTAISGNATVDGRYATFTLNNGGLLLEKGDSITVKVKGDVMAKENTSTSTIFNLNKAEDISIVESNTGFGAEIILTDTVMDSVVVSSGAISSTKKSTTPSDTEVIKGAKAVVSLIANVRADEAITADGLKIAYTGATTTSFENAKVYVNGYLLGSFDPATSPSLVDSSVNFNKGDNEVKVTVDVKTDAVAGSNIKFSIDSATFLASLSPEYVSSGNAIASGDINGSPEGAKITVQGADLTVVRNDGLADGNKIVKGVKDITLAKYNVKAIYDNVTITSITLDANTSGNTKINDSSVYDMKLFVDGVQIGSTRDFNAGATFSSLSYTIAKDSIKTIELKGSFDTANTGYLKTNLNVYGEDSRGKAISKVGYASADNSITAEGTLTVAKGADTKVSSILLAKAGVEQEIAQYKLTAVDDAANVTELTVTTSAAIDPRISEYRIYDGATLVATDNPINGSVTFKITGDKLIVPANGNKTVTMKAVFNTITSKNQTAGTLQANLTGYKFKSSAGTETATTTLTNLANTMTVRKTMPTFALISGVTGGQGSMQPVLTFSITADANEDVIIDSLTVTESGSTGAKASTSQYYLYDGDTQKAATNTSLTLVPTTALTIAKGTTKTLVVKADTSNIAVDQNFGLMLENTSTNVLWSEYFVEGNATTTGATLSGFPLSGATMKY